MIDASAIPGIIQTLLVLVMITGAMIVTRKDLIALLAMYRLQSVFLALLALTLYVQSGNVVLLEMVALTVASKVLLIPYFIKRMQKEINISRDLSFHYISPAYSLFITVALIFFSYYSLSKILVRITDNKLFYLGAVFGISLALMGMMIVFSRKKIVTKIIGYLTMENGALIFSIFITELPFVIEVLIIIDLLILVLLAAILAVGMDSSIEEFQGKLERLKHPGRNGGHH
ncbi:MAG: hydrogenase subunit [Candidatus Altiarchaeia archaeon]